MSDYDAIIIGGGPAGITAGLYLVRGKRRVIILEKEYFGGKIKNVEWIENYPGFSKGVSGAHLALEMINQSTKHGLQLKQGEVIGIELYSNDKWVGCATGEGYTAPVVIIASGSRFKKLGVSGEERLRGRGVINCALCEGDQLTGKAVVVCGGGDTGITEALYLAKLASKVIILELMPSLKASAVLRERALSNPKIEIHCGAKILSIIGENRVEAVEFSEVQGRSQKTLKVQGVLVSVGLEPNTNYLNDIVPVDNQGQIMANNKMETEVPGIFVAGDVRHNSPRQVSTAVGDGATAAISADEFLENKA